MTDEAAQPQHARLNPFAFASETSFRFLLLIVSIIGVGAFTFSWVYTDIYDSIPHSEGVSRADHELSELLSCIEEQQLAFEEGIEPLEVINERYEACTRGAYRPRADFTVAGLGAVGLTGLVLYLLAPWWTRWRRHLVPLTRDEAPQVVAALDGLVREMSLQSAPRYVWDPLDPVPSGLAFGLPGRRYVAISGGLAVRSVADPAAFRAVALHELAHIHNRDIDMSFYAVTVWRAFVVVALIPFAISAIGQPPDVLWDLGWRVGALTLLVYLSRNAILRAREFYADVRASTHEPAIRRILAALKLRHRRLELGFLRLHPPPPDRVRTVNQPGRLLRLGTLEAFGVGIAALVAYDHIVLLLGFYRPNDIATMWLSALLFAPLAASVVAAGAWRETFRRLAEPKAGRERLPLALRLGLALGAGVLVGQYMSLSQAVVDSEMAFGGGAGAGLPVWTAVVAIGLVLFVAWVASSARLWLPVTAALRSPRPVSTFALLVASFVLTISLGTAVLLNMVGEVFEFTSFAVEVQHTEVTQVVWPGPFAAWLIVMNPLLLTIAAEAVVWPLIIAIWAFPLAAVLWLNRMSTDPVAHWALLDSGRPVAIPRPDIGAGRAAAIGLIGAVSVFVALLAFRVFIRSSIPPEVRAPDEFAFAFVFWSVCIALAAQIAVALIVAARASTARVILALFAAFITGVGAAIGIVAQPSLASCVDVFAVRALASECAWLADWQSFELTMLQVLSLGFILAGAAAAVLSLFLSALHGARSAAV